MSRLHELPDSYAAAPAIDDDDTCDDRLPSNAEGCAGSQSDAAIGVTQNRRNLVGEAVC